jgi:hypothetical protein
VRQGFEQLPVAESTAFSLEKAAALGVWLVRLSRNRPNRSAHESSIRCALRV